jgi:hypothetical protein
MAFLSSRERGIGEASVLVGLSEWTIEAIDAWGRWDLVMTHIPMLAWIFSPLVAPGLVFVGMLLVAKARENEYKEALDKATAPPQFIGVEKPVIKRKSVWRPLWLIPISIVVAVLTVIANIWLYKPAQPRLVFNTPTVDPSAYSDFRDLSKSKRSLGSKVSCPQGVCGENIINPRVENEVHASAVELSGTGPYSGVTINNPTISGTPSVNDSAHLVSMDSSTGPITDGKISNVHQCYLHFWDDFLDCVGVDLTNSATTLFWVTTFRSNVKKSIGRTSLDPLAQSHCIEEIDALTQTLLDTPTQETIAHLRSSRPSCLSPRLTPQ